MSFPKIQIDIKCYLARYDTLYKIIKSPIQFLHTFHSKTCFQYEDYEDTSMLSIPRRNKKQKIATILPIENICG